MQRLALHKVIMVAFFMLSMVGCTVPPTAGEDIKNATEVNLKKFIKATERSNQFFYIGTDKKHHYFRTKDGFYKLKSDLNLGSLQFLVKRKVESEEPIGSVWTSAFVFEGAITGYNGEDPIDPRSWRTGASPQSGL